VNSMVADTSREPVRCRVVGVSPVVIMLYSFPAPYLAIREYGETSTGIARAANEDPLFPTHPSGSEATACILIACAWEATQLLKTSAQSPTLGLYGLRTPPKSRIDGGVLMIAHTGSLVAIDRIRESMRITEKRGWVEKLAPFMAERYGEKGHRNAVECSVRAYRASGRVMGLADSLFGRYFPKAKMPKGLLLESRSAVR